ncbi:MAG: YbhB/YbcL family Raf kinase inhibitor-like protein [Candidatus Woesearchaeota archaeon]
MTILLYSCSSPDSKITIGDSVMKLSSPAFADKQGIPSDYTCDGADKIPPLEISDVPANTKSLALVMDDPDAPMGTWDHWVVWNIPPTTKRIDAEPEGVSGKNSWGKTGYGGPCPPSGTHRYFFKIYALDTMLDLPAGSNKAALLSAMKGHVIAEASLMGTYQRRR